MTGMTEEWVSFWYQALSQNLDYSAYCLARQDGDSEKCKGIEAQFPKVAEIYDDFGAMDGWHDAGLSGDLWKGWFEPRRHLFLATPKEISEPQLYQHNDSNVLLDIPLQASLEATAESVRRFLVHFYQTHRIDPTPPPKYQLHQIAGHVAHGYEKVRQACLMSTKCYSYDLDTFESLSVEKGLVQFLRNEIEELGWTLDPASLKVLRDTGHIDIDRFESFKVRLNRCRREFAAMARNTIRGRFPDTTPFKSDVMDQFKGEQN